MVDTFGKGRVFLVGGEDPRLVEDKWLTEDWIRCGACTQSHRGSGHEFECPGFG